jgi:rod shape determining protein RodA
MINSIPGVKFKQTWVGSHFIPILFVVVFLSIVTLLISNETFDFFFLPGVEVPGVFGVLISLALFALVSYFLLRWVSSRRDRRRITLIVILGFILSSGIALSVNTGFQGLASHQKERIELFLGLKEDPDGRDYNRNRAMAAVGSGGLTGKGYKKASVSSVESNHVPESETDFIFCPFAEEWGFLGTIILIALYMFLLVRIVVIAERQRSTFNRVYAYAVAVILFYHFAVNIGMNIGFAPVIGIPLPFFSSGGSSMMSFSKGKQWGFIDLSGKQLVEPSFEFAESVKEGKTLVEKNGLQGMIDAKGKVLIPIEYVSINRLSRDWWVVSNGSRSGLWND